MFDYQTHYPGFDVLKGRKHWDPHTREIVVNRLDTQSFYPFQFLTQQEAETLFPFCALLLDDRRYPVIAFVVHHFDSMLSSKVGESQRKLGVPEQTKLIRDGLALLNQACFRLYTSTFAELDDTIKQEIVSQLMQGDFFLQSATLSIPVNDFMQKLLTEAVSAYYSFPTIWSEIGYAGPAYPRGYVRSELGLTDPWEARKIDDQSEI